jgi:large subunit ribosomal protein L10
VEAAKGLRDFARSNPALVIKGGVLEGRALSADEVRRLADLESREVLLAKLAGAMKASLTRAAYLFVAPLSQAARTIEALRVKQEQEGAAAGAEPTGATPTVTEPTVTEPTGTEPTVTEPTGTEPTAEQPAGEPAAAATPEPTEG